MKPLPRIVARAASILACAGALLPLTAAAQNYGPTPYPPQQSVSDLPPLDQLMAPVALYPDPLLGLILPAATEPDNVRLAAEVVSSGNDADQLASRPMGEAVKDLAHYPDVTRWMADNIQWTEQVGAAFAQQPQAVMDAVQDLRRRALQAGTLRSTPQQQVVQDNGHIEILPAQSNVVFVPRYDPEAIYSGGPDAYITWSSGRPEGPWLGFYPDWNRHSIWEGDWRAMHRGGDEHRFSIGGFGISIGSGDRGREWHVGENSPVRNFHFAWDDRSRIARPGVMEGAPGGNRYGYNRENRYPGDRYRNDRDEGRGRATFPGDEVRRDDRGRQDEQRRYEDQHRYDQHRDDERYRHDDDGGGR